MGLRNLPFMSRKFGHWFERLFLGVLVALAITNVIAYLLFLAGLISSDTGLLVATISLMLYAFLMGILAYLIGVAICKAIVDLTVQGIARVITRLMRAG